MTIARAAKLTAVVYSCCLVNGLNHIWSFQGSAQKINYFNLQEKVTGSIVFRCFSSEVFCCHDYTANSYLYLLSSCQANMTTKQNSQA